MKPHPALIIGIGDSRRAYYGKLTRSARPLRHGALAVPERDAFVRYECVGTSGGGPYKLGDVIAMRSTPASVFERTIPRGTVRALGKLVPLRSK